MKEFKKGTPAFGFLLGILFVIIGLLWMALGFWKTVLLCALFALGYFLGAVNNKAEYIKETVNRIVPEKKNEAIDLRESLTKEQKEAAVQAGLKMKRQAEEADASQEEYFTDVKNPSQEEKADNSGFDFTSDRDFSASTDNEDGASAGREE